MDRRGWLRGAGALAAGAAFSGPGSEAGAAGTAALDTEIVRLKLKHTWTTTMSSSEARDVLYVRYTRDGTTGVGEGAPIVRYQENAADAQRAVETTSSGGRSRAGSRASTPRSRRSTSRSSTGWARRWAFPSTATSGSTRPTPP
jgi:hypothetical protein